MIKLLNQYVPGRLFVLLISENALTFLGLWIIVSLGIGESSVETAARPAFLGKALFITAVCQLCFYYADLYDLRRLRSRLEVLSRLLQALGAAAFCLALLVVFIPEMRLGKNVLHWTLITLVFVMMTWRILLEWLSRAYQAGERVLVVGNGATARALAKEISLRTDLPFTVIGSVTESGNTEEPVLGLPVIGTLDDLTAITKMHRPNRIVIALNDRRKQLPLDELLTLRYSGIMVEDAAKLYEKITGKVPIDSVRPSDLIFSDGFRTSTITRLYARITGFIGVIFCLLIASPVMILTALLIKLESRGPIFYRQERVGRNHKSFMILKFRSMREGAESTGSPVWAQREDPRVTRVGKLIRKLRIDELPQFINVLYGEMSFVGPRPERPFFVDLLRQKMPFYDLRHSIRPGITGWAQVSCDYGASVEESRDKLEYDLFYLKNLSISLDLLILFNTVKIMMFGRGAR